MKIYYLIECSGKKRITLKKSELDEKINSLERKKQVVIERIL